MHMNYKINRFHSCHWNYLQIFYYFTICFYEILLFKNCNNVDTKYDCNQDVMKMVMQNMNWETLKDV